MVYELAKMIDMVETKKAVENIKELAKNLEVVGIITAEDRRDILLYAQYNIDNIKE